MVAQIDWGDKDKLTWRQKVVIRILLLVAQIIGQDKVLSEELQHLSAHISAGLGE